PLERSLTLAANSGELHVSLVFAPLPQSIQVNTNFTGGRVNLDGKPAGDLRDGQVSLDNVPSGSHVIRVSGGGADFEAQWRGEPGAVPELTRLATAKNVRATLVANAGANGILTCNCDIRTIQVDGSAVGGA